MSDVRDAVNEEIYPLEIHNFQVKEYLIEHYGDRVKFSPSSKKNEALLFFSSNLSTEEISKKVRPIDIMKEATQTLRESLLKVTFGL